MRRRVLLTAALVAAVFLWLVATLPPRPRAAVGTVDDAVAQRTIAGAFHVHSTRSDGSGDLDEIAAAAARAGLRFVVLTDHGDATRGPERPHHRHGVLVIDAVEISTNQGHVIALGAPAAPYPLGGEADAVIEDVARLGGFSIAAHPDSAKVELRWNAWNAAIDGLEWLNIDSEWRDESRLRLARAVLDYPFGKGPALAGLLDRPTTLSRWDAETERRPLVGVAGHDAHGGVGEGASRRGFRARLGVPSYEASFRTFAIRVVLESPPTGEPEVDAAAVLAAIRRGRVFTAVDAMAAPALVDYRAAAGGVFAVMGDRIAHAPAARLTVRSTLPAGATIVLLRAGSEIATSQSAELSVEARLPGPYRVEIRTPDAPGSPRVPWVVTNPIYLTSGAAGARQPRPAYSSVAAVTAPAQVEKDALSEASLTPRADGFALSYRLRDGERVSQYAAAAVPMPQGLDASGLEFALSSSAPMRVSVQLRFSDAGGSRWAKSVYSSQEAKRVVVPFSDLVPADALRAAPPFPTASAILFVVDLTNARPGQAGTFEVSGLSLVR